MTTRKATKNRKSADAKSANQTVKSANKPVIPSKIDISDINLDDELANELRTLERHAQAGARSRQLFETIADGIKAAITDYKQTGGIYRFIVTDESLANHQRAKNPAVSFKTTAVKCINTRFAKRIGGRIGCRTLDGGKVLLFYRQDFSEIVDKLIKQYTA